MLFLFGNGGDLLPSVYVSRTETLGASANFLTTFCELVCVFSGNDFNLDIFKYLLG